MDKNFIDQVRNFISPETISDLSSSTGESTTKLEKGFNMSIASVLLGFASKGEGGLSTILNQAKNHFVDSLDGSVSSSPVKGVFNSLFGDANSEVVSSIQAHSGLSTSATNSVLEQATTAVLGFFKNLSPNFDIGTITQFLSSNKGTFLAALPAGFSLAGLGKVPQVEPIRPVSQAKAQFTPVKKEKGGSLWLYLILLLIAIALIYFFLRGRSEVPDTGVNTDAGMVDINSEQKVDGTSVSTGAIDLSSRELLKVTLPDGVVINAYKGGIEDKLVVFLKSDYKNLGDQKLKDTWFDFDNLNFETNSAVITAESKPQLMNIVAILKAFPDAKLKIGGYTDKTGTEAVNLKLSGERANAVKKSIEEAGRGNQVDGAEGYGSKFAKYDANAPESDRVLDRHISVSVR
ncbi:OmpA family protein [Flavobacterium sp. NKUCC04_CG]|uniref:OmpA family protein n=1 Tax=Flavobacterium sp. NKUCC04_CG TaxID=2842121 RepID=UPI001C5B6092|nr:OmpA family protein [Flavobacterium sp. NKUCC04_CG]MBW3518986.1 OmpA family protein [Flavobacterium sp. NKUCC04_CG]